MGRYGMYDATRGLMTALAVGVAGLLLWLATQVGQQSTPRFWAEMGIVAAAGFVLAVLPALGGWTAGLRFRISPGTFLLGFLPTLVVVGWVLVATQPGHGWHDGTLTSWSRDAGILGLVHDLGLWNGVLAFGFGLVLALSLDTVPALAADEAVVVDRGYDRTVVDEGAGRPAWRGGQPAVDEPVSAEREAQADVERRPVPVGPTAAERERAQLRE